MTDRSSSTPPRPPSSRRPVSAGGDDTPRPGLGADLRRIVPVWIVLLLVALAVIWWFGTSGSRLLAHLAYTSPVSWELAQVYRADGTNEWRNCLERVEAMRQDGKPLKSAVGVLKGDATLKKARKDLLKAGDYFDQFKDIPSMLADLALWDGDAAQAYAWRGDRQSLQKNWREALAAYTIAHNMGKQTAQVEEGRLDALIQMKRWDEATSDALALRNKDFLTSRYYRLLAGIDAHKGDPKDQEIALRKALKMNPRDVDAVVQLAVFLIATKQPKEAYNLYNRTTQLVTNNGSLLHRQAQLAIQLGHPREAVKLYLKAIDLQPNTFILQYELAQLYLKLGEPNHAKPHLNRAFELDPKRFEKDMKK